jgi:hypothetical protein
VFIGAIQNVGDGLLEQRRIGINFLLSYATDICKM